MVDDDASGMADLACEVGTDPTPAMAAVLRRVDAG